MELEWLDKYCIGEENIDHQHQEIFRAVNRLLRIVDEKDAERDRRACLGGIKYLKNYTIEHFQDEEAYQQKVGYPGYKHHKQIHDEFRMMILGWEAIMREQEYSRDSVLNFIQLLTAWLITHIMEEDQVIIPGKWELK